MKKTPQKQEIVFVTGPAGAGRTTAIKAIEDFGVEVIDNLPLNLVSRIASGPPTAPLLAIGIDSRTRGFSGEALLDVIDSLKDNPQYAPVLVYLDCRAEVLLRRFSETRRRHPASPDGSPNRGIERDKAQLESLRARADVLIDTSDLSPHQLRAELARWFQNSESAKLAVSVQSFSYKRGIPNGVDMVLDCRFLRNPHWVPELRALTGLSESVGAYIQQDPLFTPFLRKTTDLLDLLLPAYQAEGKSYFSIAMGCTGGQHRSVFSAEMLADDLAKKGWLVTKKHQEMDRWPPQEAAT